MDKPFDGEISRFFAEDLPAELRASLKDAAKRDVIDASYPYDSRMPRKEYETTMEALQIELVKLQRHLTDTGTRLCVIFEGRDAAGKGGTIRRIMENLSARGAKSVALSKPTDTEKGEWYFQRYIKHLPTAGHLTIFDRSWYNRGVVEKVFGFCDDDQREAFFKQAPQVEKLLVEDGIIFRKFWLNVGRGEQMRRFLSRESDPLKQWKLSWIDVEGLKHWDAYSSAITETLERTHTDHAPWTIVRSDDKRRARIAAIQSILCSIEYAGRNADVVCSPDPKICGGPDIWHA
jgi:polyphosphate kinase 2